ncbi:MAG: helicase, partial [Myxococcales bacterium]|nr:helicase [Myxococcales bacterium]
LSHDSGMLGFPLRLLAREVYDKIADRVGFDEVALITGEEKRVPTTARYFVCTVEAMPLDLEVDFVGVDEIQLAAHPQRGHTFTDRLLYRRGRSETWFLGSQSVEHLVSELVPTARIRRHPRLSELRGAGQARLGQLKAGSAVVAFTAARVYELAERVRRRKGGAAVVLGALSPRARNAQVALYQSGDVDYLVATDAIGMGLNLSINHVAFADVRKFDGQKSRHLELSELGQIAGRAGRHLQDGTFGTLAPEPELPFEVVQALETHHFPREKQLWWRNPELEFHSLEALLDSLRAPAPSPRLRRMDQAEDQQALERLAALPSVADLATGQEAVELLWQVAQIPDYRKVLFEQHLVLLEAIYGQLRAHGTRLGTDWLANRVERLDDPKGDIEAILARIAFVRTWTYVTHHRAWVKDAAHWQARTREIEDHLSDALHQALVLRFVDRNKAFMDAHTGDGSHAPPVDGARAERASLGRGAAQALPQGNDEPASGSHPFASLQALKDRLTAKQPKATRQTLLERVIAHRAELDLSEDGQILLRDTAEPTLLGALTPGAELLGPGVRLAPELRQDRQLLQELGQFVRSLIDVHFAQLRAAGRGELGAPGRGLVYQLEQELGCVDTRRAREQLSLLAPGERALLEGLGVVFGERFVYLASLQGQRALAHRRAWLSLAHKLPQLPAGAVRLAPGGAPEHALRQLGFPRLGSYYIRVDLYERLLRHLRGVASSAGADGFALPVELCQWLGLPKQELPQLLSALGYRALDRHGKRWQRGRAAKRPRSRGRPPKQRTPRSKASAASSSADSSTPGQGRQT